MELKLIDDKGAAGTMAAKDEIFGRAFNEALVHQLVVSYSANARLATSKQKVNRKMYRAGMASILSQLAREDRIRVVEEFKVPHPKTKLLAQKVKSMGLSQVLVIIDEIDSNLTLSSRNLPNVEVIAARQANPVALVRYPTVLVTRSALARLEEMFK